MLGKTEGEAVRALSRWRVRVLTVLGSEGNDGRVINQVPAAGTLLVEGSEVAVTVARRTIDPRAAVVPSVVGLDGEVAERQVTGLGLVPLATPVASDPSGAGKVVTQDPAPGTVVAKGSNVALGVGAPASGALMETEAPDVVRLREGEARARVSQAGLVVVTRDRLAPEEAGVVLEQDPPPGARLVRGRPLTLVVGRALMLPILVPDTLGLPAPVAIHALREAGFAVEETTAVSLPGSAGKVIAQDPPGGGTAIRTSVVRIVVGRPSPTIGVNVRVPALVGRTEEQARADLVDPGPARAVGPGAWDPRNPRPRRRPVSGGGDDAAARRRGRVGGRDRGFGRGAGASPELRRHRRLDRPGRPRRSRSRGLDHDDAGRTRRPRHRADPRGGHPRAPGIDRDAGRGAGPAARPGGARPSLPTERLFRAPRARPAPLARRPGRRGLRGRDHGAQGRGVGAREAHSSDDLRHIMSKVRRGTYQWHVRARRDKAKVVGPWSEWRQITWY